MAYVINKTPTFMDVFKRAKPQRQRCTDDCHEHKSPVILAWVLMYKGHKVGVVQDGDCYSAMIDQDPRTHRDQMSFEEMNSHVEKLVKE